MASCVECIGYQRCKELGITLEIGGVEEECEHFMPELEED